MAKTPESIALRAKANASTDTSVRVALNDIADVMEGINAPTPVTDSVYSAALRVAANKSKDVNTRKIVNLLADVYNSVAPVAPAAPAASAVPAVVTH
jgi:hypothetical protein